MKAPRYVLPQHVFICCSQGYIFFLDLRKDAYVALEAAKTVSLSGLVSGWPVPSTGETREEDEAQGSGIALAERLVQSGLLCAGEAGGKAATPISLDRPTMELHSNEDRRPIRFTDALVFFMASLIGAIKYKFYSFERLVNTVKRRRADHETTAKAPDAQRTLELVRTFYKLRHYLFSSKDLCLFQSFALLEFLSYYDSFPNWVFGIQAKPFGAHCWVQQDNVLFNDSIEHVNKLVPIMTI